MGGLFCINLVSKFIHIRVGLAPEESHTLIQAIGSLALRIRGERDGGRALLTGDLQASADQCLADALPARGPVYDDVFDDGARARRDKVNRQRGRAEDEAVVRAGDQERGRLGFHEGRQQVQRRRRIVVRQLRHEAMKSIPQLLRGLIHNLNLHRNLPA